MSTIVVPEAPAVRPSPNLRFVTARANLLPAEVISARRANVLRTRILISLCVLVTVLGGGFGYSWWQTSSARGDLDTVHHQTAALRNEESAFNPLVKAQSDADSIRTQLQNLMVGDLSWKTMLGTLRAQAPSGVKLTDVSGTITAGAGGANGTTDTATGVGVLNQTGKQQVGTLSIDGTARDKNAVAAYADRLAKVKGLTAPLVSDVTSTDNGLTFTVSVIITSDALGGRFAARSGQTTGGK